MAAGNQVHYRGDPEGVLLRPLSRFPETRLEDVVGSLKFTGTRTVEEMEEAIALETRSGMLAAVIDVSLM